MRKYHHSRFLGDVSNPLDYVESTQTYTDPVIQPVGAINTTSSGGTTSADWFGFALGTMKLLPNIFSSFKGNVYGQAPGTQGQQGGGQGGFNLTGSSLLGGGSLGISSGTLMLLAVGALVIFAMKK